MKGGGLIRVRPNDCPFEGNWSAVGGVKGGNQLSWRIEFVFNILISLGL